LRFAFSRPGFLTFKIAPGKKLPDDFGTRLVFARASGFCLGKAIGATPEERADLVWKLIGERPVMQLHVWPRDRYTAGFRDYEPGMTPEVAEVERMIRNQAPEAVAQTLAGSNFQFSVFKLQYLASTAAGVSCQTILPDPPCPPLRRGREDARPLVADVVIVDDTEWWVGYHRVDSLVSSWPGGFCEIPLPADAVSRAYLKINEAFLWSGFHVRPGERCIEIGAAPGGASQWLLAQGLDVVGIDPAVIDPVVVADPHFRHIRKRSKEVPRSEFVGIDWLTCDVNLPPNYTLDAVKAIVSHPGVTFQGLLLTLKLVDWSLAEEIPKYLERVRSWGFRNIRARQLHHNRQDICVAASGFRAARQKPDHNRKVKRRGRNAGRRPVVSAKRGKPRSKAKYGGR
jgi:23S rRNA (cytidine2498-2'-O)-methyltransferase